MSKSEEAMLQAWQEYRHGSDHEFDPNEPIKPSDNFERGFIAGQSFSLTHQWRSVEEELPEDMINVLVHCSDSDPDISDCIAYLKNGIWCFMDDFYIGCTVSHWMPIPSLPDTNTKKK